MELSNIAEALIVTAGVIIAQVAISWRSQSVILYRISELEKKQDKYNNLQIRMIAAEKDIELIKEQTGPSC